MPTRSERLNQLTTGSPCNTSWDAMQGDERRRYCGQCRHDVLDFERLTPKEIRAHLEASRGQLCARLTRRDGRLSVFEPVEPVLVSLRPSAPRRASSAVAAVVTAWLGIGASHAVSVEPASSGVTTPRDPALPGAPGDRVAKSETRALVGVAIRGKITQENGQPLPVGEVVAYNVLDDRETLTVSRAGGTYSFESLPTAVYYLSARIAGFDVELQNNLMLEPGKVRQIDLIATPFMPAASLGIIELPPESPRQQFDGSDLVLVAEVGPSVVVEQAAYVERLKTLALLERGAERRGGVNSAEVMEWLVASAEKSSARGMATDEVGAAWKALEDFAASQNAIPERAAHDLRATLKSFREEGGTVSRRHRPLFLGASLTENQKARLTAALQKTKELRDVDLHLFEIVKKWDEKAAATWLGRQLRTVEPLPEDDKSVTWKLSDLADQLDDDTLRALAETARERDRGIYKLCGNDCSHEAEKLRRLAASRKDLRHQFGEAVALRHGVPAGDRK